jgi:hypothetical protein
VLCLTDQSSCFTEHVLATPETLINSKYSNAPVSTDSVRMVLVIHDLLRPKTKRKIREINDP